MELFSYNLFCRATIKAHVEARFPQLFAYSYQAYSHLDLQEIQ